MKEENEIEEEDQRFNDFLAWERASRDTIDFKKIYVDIAGDLIAGLLLSQIVYWYLPNKEGETKLRVFKRNRPCIAKARHEWWEELRLSPKQVDRALEILRKKRVIKTEIHRFNNAPTVHVFLMKKTLLNLINDKITSITKNPFLPKGQNTNSPKGKIDIPQRVKTLTETTSIDYNKDLKEKESKSRSPQEQVAPLSLSKETKEAIRKEISEKEALQYNEEIEDEMSVFNDQTQEFLDTIDPGSQINMLAAEAGSNKTIVEMLDYVLDYENKTGREVKDVAAFIYQGLINEWEPGDYYTWGLEKLKAHGYE